MSIKQKLAIFTFALREGGAERQASVLLNNLKDDYDTYLILMNKKIGYPIPENQKVIFIADTDESESLVSKILRIPYLGYKYYKVCKQNDIQISLSFCTRPNWISTFNKIFGNKKIKICFNEAISPSMEYKGDRIKGKLGRYLIKKLYPKADAIIPNSKEIKQDLIKNFNIDEKRIIPIYNPIDLRYINKNIKEGIIPSMDNTVVNFICVARFSPQKNHELLINAINIIKDKNFKLYLVGSNGTLEHEIKKQVQDLNLQEKISFEGFCSNPFVFMNTADFFVLSSNYEGFPNAVQEAMASGCAILSVDCKTGPREMLAPNTDSNLNASGIELAEYGILVPTNNKEILAEAMLKIIEDHSLIKKYKLKSLQRSLDFDVEKVKKIFIDVLNQL